LLTKLYAIDKLRVEVDGIGVYLAVMVKYLLQRLESAIVHVWARETQIAQAWHFEFVHVFCLEGGHCGSTTVFSTGGSKSWSQTVTAEAEIAKQRLLVASGAVLGIDCHASASLFGELFFSTHILIVLCI